MYRLDMARVSTVSVMGIRSSMEVGLEKFSA